MWRATSATVGSRQNVGQLGGGRPDLKGEVLQWSVHVDAPRPVAEVALDLAADGGHGEGGERAAAGIVPVDGLDQPSRATCPLLIKTATRTKQYERAPSQRAGC
jgi:hypothetical protein